MIASHLPKHALTLGWVPGATGACIKGPGPLKSEPSSTRSLAGPFSITNASLLSLKVRASVTQTKQPFFLLLPFELYYLCEDWEQR